MYPLDPTIALQIQAEMLLLTAECEGVAISSGPQAGVELMLLVTSRVRRILDALVPELKVDIRVTVSGQHGSLHISLDPVGKTIPYFFPEDF